MALLRKLLTKQKTDREEAERKRDALLEKRRGYAKAARDRELARQNGLSDLPPLIAVTMGAESEEAGVAADGVDEIYLGKKQKFLTVVCNRMCLIIR
jgi:hypothetical protein